MSPQTRALLIKILLFVVGVVVGGALVFGVEKLTDDSSSSEDGSSNTPGSRVTDSLRFVVVISRHGNKVVPYNYPLDPYPYDNKDYWKYESQELTVKGRRQAYNLGVKFRSLYNGFLSSTYNYSDVYACSDKVYRVIMSGESVLAGLYPPQGWQMWSKKVDWQPIPLLTNSSDHSVDADDCEKIIEDGDAGYATFLENEAANISALTTLVYQKTSENLTVDQLANMYAKLSSEETEGYALPKWTEDLYPDPLYDYYGKWYLAITSPTDEVARLYVGDLFEDITSMLEGKVDGSLVNRKIAYYSAHDSTLLNLQVAIGMNRSSLVKVVHTGSSLLLELHQDSDSGTFSLQALYVDGAALSSEPMTIDLPECGNPCQFLDFVTTTAKFTNVSFTEECGVLANSFTNLSQTIPSFR